MNTQNNARRQTTILNIQKAYMDLCISRSDISTITVSDICKKAGINRTTFYSIYLDISDLRKAIEEYVLNEFLYNFFKEEAESATHSMDFNKLFVSIKENQIFYKLYFKLGFDFKKRFLENGSDSLWQNYFKNREDLDYHIEFFSAGITAIIQKWLDEGCEGSPERMSRIIRDEYQKKNDF